LRALKAALFSKRFHRFMSLVRLWSRKYSVKHCVMSPYLRWTNPGFIRCRYSGNLHCLHAKCQCGQQAV